MTRVWLSWVLTLGLSLSMCQPEKPPWIPFFLQHFSYITRKILFRLMWSCSWAHTGSSQALLEADVNLPSKPLEGFGSLSEAERQILQPNWLLVSWTGDVLNVCFEALNPSLDYEEKGLYTMKTLSVFGYTVILVHYLSFPSVILVRQQKRISRFMIFATKVLVVSSVLR